MERSRQLNRADPNRLETPDPEFDPHGAEYGHRVLVRTGAFSCNYRDRAIPLRIATGAPTRAFVSVDSELAGEVGAVGREVSGLRPAIA